MEKLNEQITPDYKQSYELLLRVAVRLLFWKENELSKFVARKAARVKMMIDYNEENGN